jgi:2,4-dienoyl-CoA reductase-like NADH-dependent reductase (Old Yellow Enzyme family)
MIDIFSSCSIGKINLKNRIIRSATHESLADDFGNPTEELRKKYEALAKGEVGAIITGYTGIMQNGKAPFGNMLMIDQDERIPYYKELVNGVHKFDTPIILQIAHCGRQTDANITKCPTVAPSAIRDKLYFRNKPHELTTAEINEIIGRFVEAVVRAKDAGFDGVQLHLAHGYLLSSFLSPHMNKRNDQWGGNVQNRFRIVSEIIREARKAVGPYPIWAKINGYEKSKDGLKIDDSVMIAKLLEQAGCDAIEVSCGIAEEGFVTSRGGFPFEMIVRYEDSFRKVPPILYPLIRPFLMRQFQSPQPIRLYNAEAAEKIKKNVNIPVVVVGGIRTSTEIQDLIGQGKCDAVAMSRPFIIEPNIVQKFSQGKTSESKCINCNYCMVGVEKEPLRCYYGKLRNPK